MADNANRNNGRCRLAVTGSLILCLTAFAHAQQMTQYALNIRQVTNDFSIGDIDHREWKRADEVAISTYWNGDPAPPGRQMQVRMLWSSSALYVRFEANQAEPLVVSEKAQVAEKTMRLWDRDVAEIFLAHDRKQPRKYL